MHTKPPTPLLQRLYYRVKPLIPRRLQLALRRKRVELILPRVGQVWPIDPRSSTPPAEWRGWPDNKKFALVLTHDVEWQGGHDKCGKLAAVERGFGVRSSFNFVPQRYRVSQHLRERLVGDGFEVGVHGLNHDGREFESEAAFSRSAVHINDYLHDWNAVGFRAPCMRHNLEWISRLNIEYDASTFDTDPFEPQPDGMGTIFPFVVRGSAGTYVELPYTLVQDHTLFVMLQHQDCRVWKRKLDWIAEHGGMALITTHPDYMHFGDGPRGAEEYPVRHYEHFLDYAIKRYSTEAWLALPRDVARHCRKKLDAAVSAVASYCMMAWHLILDMAPSVAL